MKSIKTYVIMLLALTTAGGAALAWRQYHELVELRAGALNKDERANLQKRIWDLEKANRQMADQLAARRLSPGMGASEPAVRQVGEEDREGPGREGPGGRGGRGGNMQQAAAFRELMAKPEVQAIIETQRKLGIEQRYAALFKNLNISPEQQGRLTNLLAERQTTMQDVLSAAREQGISPGSEGFRKLVADAQGEIANGIKSILGDTGYAQLQNYEQTMPQRSLVNDLQLRLINSNHPLSATQADQLVQILAANPAPRPAPPEGGGRGSDGGRGFDVLAFAGRADLGALASAFLGGPGGIASGGGFGGAPTQITEAAINQAQTILTSAQLTALQQVQQQQQAQQQLQQLVRGTMPPGALPRGSNATSGSSGPPGRP